jgi:hypothetical protein
VLHRAATCGWDTFKRLVPLLEDAREALVAAASGAQPVETNVWSDRVRDRLSAPDMARVLAVGCGDAVDYGQLCDGLASIAPRTSLALDLDDPDGEAIASFAAWSGHLDRAPLVERLDRWMHHTGVSRVWRELLSLERAIAQADLRADDTVERLCVSADALPEDFEGVVVRNEAFEVISFEVDVMAWYADPQAPLTDVHEATALLVGSYRDGVSILPAPGAVLSLWDALADTGLDVADAWRCLDDALAGVAVASHLPNDADTWLDELLAAGALGFIPAR